MCLCVEENKTIKFASKKRTRTYIIGYKVVEILDQRINSPLFPHTWKPGYNKSNSKRKNVCSKQWVEISRGIHVFLHKKDARMMQNRGFIPRRIIPVICYLSDFIACGNINDAVFTKVFLPKTTYNKALNS